MHKGYILLLVVLIVIVIWLLYLTSLVCIGWKDLDEKMTAVMKTNCVIVYPHNSYYDLLVGLNYRYRYPKLFGNVKFLINPFWYSVLPCKESIGLIESSNLRSKGSGRTKKIVEELEKYDRYQLAISPKGTVKNTTKWRSGYWWIAKSLNINIAVIDINYNDKCLKLKGVISPGDCKDDDEKTIREWMP